MDRVIEVLCNSLAATGIAGQQHIATYIPFHTLDMELFFSSLHKITLFTV
jgi:hypothetical protein